MTVTFASGRSQLSNTNWTLTTTADCGYLTSKSLYFTLQGVNASGVNVPIVSNLVEIDTNDRLTISILSSARLSGEEWTHFVIGCSETNDPTTTNQIAKIPCCSHDSLGNINLLSPVSFPINVVFDYDTQLSTGEVLDDIPTTNLISGIRYAFVEKDNNIYEYDQYSTATVDDDLVLSANVGRWILRDNFSPYISNAQYLGGCSVDLLNISNFDTITIPNYKPNGGNSPVVKFYLVNDTGGDIPEGYAIFLNVQVGGYNKSDLFDKKIEYYIEGFVNTSTGILRTDYYGTSDPLQFLNIQKTHSSRFPTLVLEDVVKNGEAVLLTLILRCDLLEVQGKLPNAQIQILPEMLPMSGTFNPLGGLFEKGIILSETGFNKRRILPEEGLNVKVESGVGIVKDFNFWKPSTAIVSGLTANSTNELYITKDGDIYVDDTEANDSTLRAIVKCEVKESKLSTWSSYSAVSLNSGLLVTVNYPCDENLNATIRSNYPDVIASKTAKFNANKLNLYIQRQSDGQIRKFSNLNVVAVDSQVFTITDWSSGTIVTVTPSAEVSFYNPSTATFTQSLGTGNLIATNYRVAYSLVWNGSVVSDISHAVGDGCIPESLITGEQLFGSNVYNTVGQIRSIANPYDGKFAVCSTTKIVYVHFSTYDADDDGVDYLESVFGGFWVNIAKNALTDVSNTHTALVDPTVNDDEGDNYAVGDKWINTSTDKEFTLFDNTIGAAVWKRNVHSSELGTAASRNTGTAIGNVVELEDVGGQPKLPAVDGSQLTNLPITTGSLQYQGTWNANINSPTIPSASNSNKGHYYVVSVAGTTTVSGLSEWAVSDWIVSNGTTWNKVDNSDQLGSSATWGSITGTLSDQTDLQTALNDKVNTSDVVNNLTTTTSGKVADARALKTLKDLIDAIPGGGTGNEFLDNLFRIKDNTDSTKQVAFELSGITTETTRTLTAPDTSGTLNLSTTYTDKALYYYDATSKLFKPISIGTPDQVLVAKPSLDPPYQFASVSSSGGREALTSDRTYYVRTDGNDSNNGLANTVGGAFLTWEKAESVITKLDGNGYSVTIKGNGTFNTSKIDFSSQYIGIKEIIVEGDTATPSNCTISPVSGSCLYINTLSCPISVKGLRLISSTSGGIGIFVARGDITLSDNCIFGACQYSHIYISGAKSQFNQRSGYTITGNAQNHIACYDEAVFDANGTGYTVSISQDLTFQQFILFGRGAGALFLNINYSTSGSSVTGIKYVVEALTRVTAIGTTFPGSGQNVHPQGYYGT